MTVTLNRQEIGKGSDIHGTAARHRSSQFAQAQNQTRTNRKGDCGMLVLTRKIGEEIIINDEICVSVVRLRGNRVQIGIKAPSGVPIRRRELIEPKSARVERTPVVCQ
jgi:carbon storage regulator